MTETVTVLLNDAPVRVEKGAYLSVVATGEMPCGGHGKCGKCKVRATGALSPVTEEERRLLSREELEGGVRLACVTRAIGDCTVESVTVKDTTEVLVDGVLPEFTLAPAFTRYGVAIDVGTTTVAARLYDESGWLLSDASRVNPQEKWGADVVSRIEAALGGEGDALREAIAACLDELIVELSAEAGIVPAMIDGVSVTGNTVMLSLLTGESVEPFSHAPFAVRRLFGETLTAESLGLSSLSPETEIYLPPAISAFVGADTTCAVLATGLTKGENALLCDIGTNGEMALCHEGKLTVCSTAAGPAFEGVGISMGMRGAVGAIDKVTVQGGRLDCHVIGGGTPKGICGSGLVDAIASLLDLGDLDESGFLEDEEYTLLSPISLTQQDVRMFQLAKSAIAAGLETLIQGEGVKTEEIPVLYIAGGFGSYLNPDSAARVGLLRGGLARVSTAVGNAALAGASLLLLSRGARDEAAALARSARTLVLSSNPTFSELYMMGMTFEEE